MAKKKKNSKGKVVCNVRSIREDTINLSNTVGVKPSINSIIDIVADRMEREEREKYLKSSKKRYNQLANALLFSTMFDHDDCYTDEDGDIYDYDGNYYGNIYEDFCGKKSNKRGKRGKSKKAYKDNMSDSDFAEYCSYFKNRTEDSYEFSDYEECKCIYFYPDIENESQYNDFDTIESFKSFCKEKGYYIPNFEFDNMRNQTVTYCCLDPVDEDYGEHTIVTDHTFGGLYWTVAEDLKKYETSIVGTHDAE